MPAEYQIDRDRRLVLSRAWGELNPADLLGHGLRLKADPDFSPDFRQLWDLTEIKESITSFADLTALAKMSVFSPTARRAVLAPADVAFGMGRMFQMLRETHGETGIRVFRDRDVALRWLETGEEPAPPPRTGSANPVNSTPRRG